MIAMTAARIAEVIGARIAAGDPQATARSVTLDSRRATENDCFFAIVGEHHDGHGFLLDARDSGARVLIAHRLPDDFLRIVAGGAALLLVADTTVALQELAAWLRRELDPKVVAITGSLGKTTTKELAATLLRRRYEVHASPGNLNNHWGLPLSLLGLEAAHEVMVAELAMSNAGEIRSLARLAAPDVGVITNIAPAHMENFADLDEVAAAKAELAEELPASATLILNADDPRTAAIATGPLRGPRRVLLFGLADGADVRANGVVRTPDGWRFDLEVGGRDGVAIELAWPGTPGLSSFLAAAALAWALDVPVDLIAESASTLEPLPDRGAVRLVSGITLLDESYNASPVAMAAALDTLASLPAEGRRIAVLGDMLEMGSWTEAAHGEVGQNASDAGVEQLVVVGAYARFVARGAAESGLGANEIHQFDTAEEAASWLAPRLHPGDVVLVKGSRAVHMERVVDAIAGTTTTKTVSDGGGKG